ncbi:lipoprotein [Rheinheimera baltica]|uniref:LPS translocon maturation chaperone LptM n=1 Tax=Rheinheimera baltica TaxID=67576 RepID=UPI00273DE0F0|nr:lipoprotein [Rheinheimera baltica]MDP5144742.1 lipoprotein [Rheinheimera baltica]
MHAFTTKGPLLTIAAVILLCSLLSACGQKGPLTLPQQAPEVAEPQQNTPISTQQTDEQRGPL